MMTLLPQVLQLAENSRLKYKAKNNENDMKKTRISKHNFRKFARLPET